MNKTIIFDADGTLLDSLWVWESLVKNYLLGLKKIPEPNIVDTLWSMTYKEGVSYIKQRYNLDENETEIDKKLQQCLLNYYEKEVYAYPSVLKILSNLSKQGMRIFIASASPNKILIPCFIRNNIYDYIEQIITEESLALPKSSSEFYKKISYNYNLNPFETVVIDDSSHALISAKKCEMKTIGILNGNSIESFKKCADMIIDKIGDLNENSIINCR